MLWLARDNGEFERGCYLFWGTNPPHWVGGVSQSRMDGTCELLGELLAFDCKHVPVSPGEAIEVTLIRPSTRPKTPIDMDYDQI